MRLRSLVLLISIAAAPLVGLFGCSGDSREKASFAALSASDREDLTQGSMGSFQFSLVVFASIPSPTLTCPAVNISGGTTTISGNGCVDDDGVKWSGALVAAVNATGLTIQLNAFSIVDTADTSNTITVDGEVISAASGATIRSDLVITVPEQEIHHVGGWTSLSFSGGVISSGSSVELKGKGYVDTSGQWDLNAKSGAIELEGEETLRVDFATYASGCASATLDGVAAGEVCLDAEASARAPSRLSFLREALARAAR